jgi:hypothetical protein
MNFKEFLTAGIISILIFFLILFFILEIFIHKFTERVCLMACREFKNSNFYKFDYSDLKCECCNLVNGSLYCESIWKK